MIDSEGDMHLTVDSLIEIDNIITGSNNNILRKVNVKLYGFDKMCMDKKMLHQMIEDNTVCYYHVMYAFQGEFTLYSCLNIKELLARNRREI